MDFKLTEEQKIYKEQFRKIFEKEVLPYVEEAEEKGEFPVQLFKRFGELGLLGITYPPEYGGAGLDMVTFAIYAEELGRINSGIAGPLIVQSSIGTEAILHLGTEEQKQKYLIPAMKGEKIFAFSSTEPSAGSDLKSIRTVAKKQGNKYIINGIKTLVTNGPIADVITLVAQTDFSKGYKGIGLFLVEKGTPGFRIGRIIRKLGNNPSPTAELIFEDCVIPEENRLGPDEGGFYSVMHLLNDGRIVVAARALGIAIAAYEAAYQYAQDRVAFGKKIYDFQEIQHKIVDMAVNIEAARLLIYKAAWKKDMGMDYAKAASMAKLFATEVAEKVTRDAVQVFGGFGYTKEFPVERYFRDARLMTIIEGTSEIQRLIIGRRLVKHEFDLV